MSKDKDNDSDNTDNTEKTNVVPSETFRLKMAEASTIPPSLVLLMGPLNLVGKQWNLERNEILIGRLAESNICIDDRSISRKHAMIRVMGDSISIEDLGSSNGTEVGGKKLSKGEVASLIDNQQVKMGNVIFKYLEEGNIESASVKESYERSHVDPLTQIYNKRAFLNKISEIFKKASITKVNLSLIVFDLDNFKKVNDTYGHQAGDYVLRELASVVKSKLRPSDYFSRYGGEEFTILITGGDLNIAIELAERLRQAIENHNFVFDGQLLEVTISAGVSCLEPGMESWEDLFEKADKASYKSKQNGKNQVSTL